MTIFDTPIAIMLDGLPVEILGIDTGSYVAGDGRTWAIPAGQDPVTDSAGIEQNPTIRVVGHRVELGRQGGGHVPACSGTG